MIHSSGPEKKNSNPLILIEALAVTNDSGLGKVTRLFLESLKTALKEEPVLLLTPKYYRQALPESWRQKNIQPRSSTLWRTVSFPLILFWRRPQQVVCLGQTLPAWRPGGVQYHLLIPDVGPLEDLPFPTSKFDSSNKNLLKNMIPRATVLWSISEFTGRRARSLLPIERTPIHVIYPRYQLAEKELEGEGHPFPPYVLSLGNIEPRKNYPALIQAFDTLCDEIPEPLHLVILGHKAWGFSAVKETLQNCRYPERIHCPGHISEAEKWAWMRSCLFYVSASLYEGWGLPLYEALYLGKPSIYNHQTAQNEFAEGFAVGINTADIMDLKSAMLELYNSREKRNKLSAGLKEEFRKMSEKNLSEKFREIFYHEPRRQPSTGSAVTSVK